MKKILVALSGGVDSSMAAALLLEAGYAVSAVYMRTWMHEDTVFAPCPWQEDRQAAQEAAKTLGIPFKTLNLINGYQEHVVQALVEGYRKGLTPNPDILCNRHIKFGLLCDYARQEGFEGLATGHYCQVKNASGHWGLWEARDTNKDQSYFLALVRPDILSFVHFPLGTLTKPEVRARAQALGLPNAQRKDSQGICFLGKVPIQDFLRQYIPDAPGPILAPDGRILGQHKGLHNFTLGQRRGIGVPSNTDNKAYVVIGKDFASNALQVAFDEPQAPGLYHSDVRITHVHWLSTPLTQTTQILGKPRFRDPSQPLTFSPQPDSTARIHFSNPQRALAPGQVLALYSGQQLLGGGVYY